MVEKGYWPRLGGSGVAGSGMFGAMELINLNKFAFLINQGIEKNCDIYS